MGGDTVVETIDEPNLLQCERVDVVDIRPVVQRGQQPRESIRLALNDVRDGKILVLVTESRSESLEAFVRSEGFRSTYRRVNEDMYWLVVFDRSSNVDFLEVNGPGRGYVLITGNNGRIVYQDCRRISDDESDRWLEESLETLDKGDLIVLHSNQPHHSVLNRRKSISWNVKEIADEHNRFEVEKTE